MGPRVYPEAWENKWLECIKRFYKTDTEASLNHLLPHIQYLSDLFTKERPKHFKDYGTSFEHLLAYGVFFFPQSFIRARLPIVEAYEYRGWRPAQPEIRILDLGAGLGACSLGIATCMLENNWATRVQIDAVDHSRDSLQLLASLAQDVPQIHVRTHVGDVRKLDIPKDKWDIIVMGFSLNEAFGPEAITERVAFLRRLKSLCEDHGLVLVVEPALQLTSNALEATVNALLEQAVYVVAGPSLNAHKPSALIGSFWQHEVRSWNVPSSLQYVNRTLFRSVQELKFSYALLSKVKLDVSKTQGHYRLTSPMALTKSGFLFSAVNTEGECYAYELPVRAMSKSQIKAIQAIERGSSVYLEGLEPMKRPQTFRVQQLKLVYALP